MNKVILDHEIAKGKIGNALTSVAQDHVVAVTEDLFDEVLSAYQGTINETVVSRLKELDGIQAFNNDDYIIAFVDSTGTLLLGVDYFGRCVINRALNFASENSEISEMENGNAWVYAIVDQSGNLLFGIDENGKVAFTYSEIEDKVDRIAQDVYASLRNLDEGLDELEEDLGALTRYVDERDIELAQDILALRRDTEASASTLSNRVTAVEEGMQVISDKLDETIESAHTISTKLDITAASAQTISEKLDITALSGYTMGLEINEIVERLKDFEGIQMFSNDEYIFALVDSTGSILLGVNYRGETVINNALKLLSDDSEISIMENGNDWVYAVVDQKGNVLFGIDDEGKVCFYRLDDIESSARTISTKLDITAASAQTISAKLDLTAESANTIASELADVVDGIEVFEGRTIGTFTEVFEEFGKIENKIKPLESIRVEESGDNLFAVVDSNGVGVLRIDNSGVTSVVNGINAFDEAGMHPFEDQDFIYAIVDSNNAIVGGIDSSGRTHVGTGINFLSSSLKMDAEDVNDWIVSIIDMDGNVVFGIKDDGSTFVNTLEGVDIADNYVKSMEDKEFVHTIMDKSGNIVFGVWEDGSIYIPNGMAEDTKKEIRRIDDSMTSIEMEMDALKEKMDTFDWSNKASIVLPMPRSCASVEITGTVPPSKYTEVKGVLTYNDVDGNSFTKPIIWSRQGNISAGFDKPNFGIDILASTETDDEGAAVEFPITFGNWPAQDSFHLKAYYSDFWKIRSLGSYHHQMDITAARNKLDMYPWDKYKFGAVNQTQEQALKGGVGDLANDLRNGAIGHPDGFPFMLTINGIPYGLYTWNLKKHKDNYMITKNDATGNEVFFGDRLYGYFNRTQDQVWGYGANENLYPTVSDGDGETRTAYAPTYSGGTIQMVFEHSASTDNGVTLTVSNLAGDEFTCPVNYNGSAVTTENTWEDGEYVRVARDAGNNVFNVTKLYPKWEEGKAVISGTTWYDKDVFEFEVSGKTSEVTIYRRFTATKTVTYDDQMWPCNGILNEETGEVTPGTRIYTLNTLKPTYLNWQGFDIKYPKEKLARNYNGLDENGYKTFKYDIFDYDSPNNYASVGIYERSHELVDGKYEFWGAKGEVREGMTNLNGATLSDGTPIKENLYLRAVAARNTVETYEYSNVILGYTLSPKNIFEWGFMPNSTVETYEADFYALTSAQQSELRRTVRKTIFDEHVDVDYAIDYFIVTQDLCYYDSITHNTLYMMYDGKHLVPTVYDMDITMGMNSTYVNSFPAVSTGIVQTGAYNGYVWEFYKDEIKERYAKYREAGAISEKAYYKIVNDMVESIGYTNYELEAKYWSQPSYRGPVFWKMPAGTIRPTYNKAGEFKAWGYDESINKALPTANSWSSAETVNVNYTFAADTIGDQPVYSGITEGVAGATILSTAFNPTQTDKGTDADNTNQTVSATLMAPGVTIPSTMHIVIESGNITVTQVTDPSHTSWDGDPILAQHAPVELTGTATNIVATSHAAGKKFSFTADLQLKSADDSIIINTKMSCAVTGGGKLTPAQNSVSEGSIISMGVTVFSGTTILSATTEGGVTTVSGRTTLSGVNTKGVALSGVLNMSGVTAADNACTINAERRSGNITFLDMLTLTGSVESGAGEVRGAASSGVTFSVGDVVNDGAHHYSCLVEHNAREELRPSNAYTCGNPGGGVYDSPRRTYEWLIKRMSYLDVVFGYKASDITLQSLSEDVTALSGNVNTINEQLSAVVERLGGETEGIQILYNTGDYLYAIVDTEGKLIFAIETDGTTYIAKGIPEDVAAEIERIDQEIAQL